MKFKLTLKHKNPNYNPPDKLVYKGTEIFTAPVGSIFRVDRSFGPPIHETTVVRIDSNEHPCRTIYTANPLSHVGNIWGPIIDSYIFTILLNKYISDYPIYYQIMLDEEYKPNQNKTIKIK